MRAQIERLIRAEGNWKNKNREKNILIVMPLEFCYKWTCGTFSWCQKRGCSLVLFMFQLYLLTLLFQCFHSKCKNPWTASNFPVHFSTVITVSHQAKNPVRSFLRNKSLFLSKLSNRILTLLRSWPEHWTSKLRTHSGMYAWVLMKFPTCAIQSASFSGQVLKSWGIRQVLGGENWPRIHSVWIHSLESGPSLGLLFSRRALPF